MQADNLYLLDDGEIKFVNKRVSEGEEKTQVEKESTAVEATGVQPECESAIEQLGRLLLSMCVR